MIKKHNIAVLISGRGTNLARLIFACKSDDYPAKIECVISNNSNAKGLRIAKLHNIPTFIIQKEFYNVELGNILNTFNINIICLAGFMRILPTEFVQAWENKIINIHPSLLPSFKGLKAQKQALDFGVKITGCTVHYVDDGLDTGKIIMQAAVPILENDTVNSLSERILKAEHKCYPIALKSILIPDFKIKKFILPS